MTAIKIARQYCGLTMVELLIVLAMIAILMTAGIPSYVRYQERAVRTAAMAGLLQCASTAEQIASIHLSYQAVDADEDGVPDADICTSAIPSDDNPAYRIVIESLSTTAFRFAAIPVVGARMEGTGKLSIDSVGVRGWDRNADGKLDTDAIPSELGWQQ